MTWASVVQTKGHDLTFAAAWRRGQRVRTQVEKLSKFFFQEMVTVGVDVPGAPRLGQFTPRWEPLSNSWLHRKTNPNFYFDTGALESALLRKSTEATFGRPVVMMKFNGETLKVTSAPPPEKHGSAKGPFLIEATPFPRVTNLHMVEDIVAEPGSKTFFKLINPKGKALRPLVSPFTAWYINVKLKQALK